MGVAHIAKAETNLIDNGAEMRINDNVMRQHTHKYGLHIEMAYPFRGHGMQELYVVVTDYAQDIVARNVILVRIQQVQVNDKFFRLVCLYVFHLQGRGQLRESIHIMIILHRCLFKSKQSVTIK
ncbi:MAG: hypothetical protein EOO38_24055 [Cytophagaceae bacterium]|nr:MAG: hypothetical protein EOO38_24055 [Cytophagaceae bacterium]